MNGRPGSPWPKPTPSASATNFAGNNLENAEVIEAMGMLPAIRSRWNVKHQRGMALQQIASDRAGAIGAGTRFARLLQQSLILGLGALLVIEGELSPGGMIAASILMGRLLAPIEQAIAVWKGLSSARSAYGRLQNLLAAIPARDWHVAPAPCWRPVPGEHCCHPAEFPGADLARDQRCDPRGRGGWGDRPKRVGQVVAGQD